MSAFGLIGTITSDTIEYDDGRAYRNLGGVLYQAAVLCGLGERTALFSNCGEGMRAEVESLVAPWPGLDRKGLAFVPGPGNRVRLRYSERSREREEVLASVVPPLEPGRILGSLPELDLLLMVFNSGFDIDLAGWRTIAGHASCPVWLDVHSLALAAVIGLHRDYRPLPDWPAWVRGVEYLQANRQEVASLLGRPERWPDEAETTAFLAAAFDAGVGAVLITQGKDGVLAATPGGTRIVRAPAAPAVVDTTGCGDVFAAAAARALAGGAGIFEAVEAGVALASRAVASAGLRETFELAVRDGRA